MQTHVAIGRSRLDFFRRIQHEDEAALRAGELLVPAHQGRRHGTSGNDKRLSLEAADDEGEDERDHDCLHRVAVPLAGRLSLGFNGGCLGRNGSKQSGGGPCHRVVFPSLRRRAGAAGRNDY